LLTSRILDLIINALATIVFVNRYVAGIALRLLRGHKFDETTDDFEPSVEVIIPMFNEGAAIEETLQSLLLQDYPRDKLLVTVVDDCSTDDSVEHAHNVARFSNGRLRVLKNPRNMGKRHSIIRAVRESKAEIIVSVDSDVFVEKQAVRQLVRRFVSPEIAAVGGRVDVRNPQDNWLTRMQVVKYWYSYSFLKNLEWSFRRVMCLSGCLTAYRRHVLIELEPELVGREIKYGEDRFLTRKIVARGYHTTMTHDAVCKTFVPTTLTGYFSQQLRWRRSNIVDYLGGISHVWRLNPVIAIHFFSLFGLLVAYPALVTRSIMQGTFFRLTIAHIIATLAMGLLYRWRVRRDDPSTRVGAMSFVPFSFVMPVVYALLTPVALFTLDSSSWETRKHTGSDDELPGTEPVAEPVPVLAKPLPQAASIGLGAREASAGRAQTTLASQIIE
jgi:cellulose synthase/poly-beta-1,6-N-acetylglucosamine synthase-like glycosyltransferase